MMESESYLTDPALTLEQWYADAQQPVYTASPQIADEVAIIKKNGSIVELQSSRGREVLIGEVNAKKALAAIALRAFSHKDGSPIVSHAMIDRIESGQATSEDVAILRSLLPPREFEASC